MILVHQRYFAKPGLRRQVLQTRIEASSRLAELGVPTGRIWVPVPAEAGIQPPEIPDVIWECTYASLPERERIRAAQEADTHFASIRARQREQLVQWRREQYRLLE